MQRCGQASHLLPGLRAPPKEASFPLPPLSWLVSTCIVLSSHMTLFQCQKMTADRWSLISSLPLKWEATLPGKGPMTESTSEADREATLLHVASQISCQHFSPLLPGDLQRQLLLQVNRRGTGQSQAGTPKRTVLPWACETPSPQRTLKF